MKIPAMVADEGVVLMNLSLKPIALDRGAAAILNVPNQQRGNLEPGFCVPEEILKVLTNGKPSDLSALKTHFRTAVKTHYRIGEHGYICRAYLMEPDEGVSTQPMVALHLQRDSSAGDAVYQVADQYHLTLREKEALMWISMGVTCKEVAGRMNISPNTVKAYLRLIMIKMGVTRRAEIMGKLLQHNGNGSSANGSALRCN